MVTHFMHHAGKVRNHKPNILAIKPLFASSILEIYFAENSLFGKILKLFIINDYVEKNCVWLIFKECIYSY